MVNDDTVSNRFTRVIRDNYPSVAAAARSLYVSRETIVRYCEGRNNIPSDVLRAVCGKCKVSADWILGLRK